MKVRVSYQTIQIWIAVKCHQHPTFASVWILYLAVFCHANARHILPQTELDISTRTKNGIRFFTLDDLKACSNTSILPSKGWFHFSFDTTVKSKHCSVKVEHHYLRKGRMNRSCHTNIKNTHKSRLYLPGISNNVSFCNCVYATTLSTFYHAEEHRHLCSLPR